MTKATPEHFEPFADDASVRSLGGLSIENGMDRIAVHGSLDITRDRAGLDAARKLRETFEAITRALEGQDLPEQVAEAPEAAPREVKNPFA